MKDKAGNKITIKEFFIRWGKGVEGITALQKLKIQVSGTKISLIGLFLGLVVSLYAWEKLWWVAIILIGAILNTGVQYLGQRQQLNQLKNLEESEEVDLDKMFGDEVEDVLDEVKKEKEVELWI